MRFCSVGSPPFCTPSGEAPKLAKTFFFTAKFHSGHSEHPTSAPRSKNTLGADRSARPLHVGIGRGPIFDEGGRQSEIGNSSRASAAPCATAAILTYRQHHRTIDLGQLLKPDGRRSEDDMARHDRIFSRLPALPAEEAFQEGSMRRLPFLFFAAAIAIWGLASIPGGS